MPTTLGLDKNGKLGKCYLYVDIAGSYPARRSLITHIPGTPPVYDRYHICRNSPTETNGKWYLRQAQNPNPFSMTYNCVQVNYLGGCNYAYPPRWGATYNGSVSKPSPYDHCHVSFCSNAYPAAYIKSTFLRSWLISTPAKFKLEWEGTITTTGYYTYAGVFVVMPDVMLWGYTASFEGTPTVTWARETITQNLPDLSEYPQERLDLYIGACANDYLAMHLADVKIYNFALLDASDNVLYHVRYSEGDNYEVPYNMWI